MRIRRKNRIKVIREKKDEAGFKAREIGALGKDLGKGIGRELGRFGKDLAVESVLFATDALASLVMLGQTAQTPTGKKSQSQRKRRTR